MGKIKGWKKSRFKSTEPNVWYSNSGSRIAVKETIDGFYHVFYNAKVSEAPSQNHSIKYSTRLEKAKDYAINYMKRNPNG